MSSRHWPDLAVGCRPPRFRGYQEFHQDPGQRCLGLNQLRGDRMNGSETEDTTIYKVVVNHEEQYSI